MGLLVSNKLETYARNENISLVFTVYLPLQQQHQTNKKQSGNLKTLSLGKSSPRCKTRLVSFNLFGLRLK